ncbi:unnamed protein product [Haemonchus placei]|uniref:Cation_ATPase_N domain-containing protein n=1 Tax=Haemonchus placei TaxID=6290 RepID=A0A158QMK3_HAEPC|nr:unnamed protein product [Haemonchus placei]
MIDTEVPKKPQTQPKSEKFAFPNCKNSVSLTLLDELQSIIPVIELVSVKSRSSLLVFQKNEYTDKELFALAARSRDRQAIREFQAAICCHGLTENGVRRAKQRQDIYFVLKGFLLYIQKFFCNDKFEMICALLVSLTAVIVFQHFHRGMESVYFASELAIEVLLLLLILLIIEVELQGCNQITCRFSNYSGKVCNVQI